MGACPPAAASSGRSPSRSKAQVLARFIPHRLVTMTGEPPIKEHLATLRELIESGKVTPIIDRIYP